MINLISTFGKYRKVRRKEKIKTKLNQRRIKAALEREVGRRKKIRIGTGINKERNLDLCHLRDQIKKRKGKSITQTKKSQSQKKKSK